MLARKKVVQAKIESVKGTAETTGFTDILAFESVINPTAPFDQRKGPDIYLGHTQTGIVEERSGTFTCGVELRGNGSNAMDSGLSILLQCCGLKNTSESYKVSSAEADHKTCTIHVFEDGVKKILYGAFGNVNLEGITGKKVMCNFEFQGIFSTVADVALPAFSPSAETPPVLQGGTFTIGGADKKIGRFGLNLGNEITNVLDVNAAGGIAYAALVDTDSVFTCDLEAQLVATYDIHGIWLAGTQAAVSIVLGSGAGKQITISIPKLQYREIPEGERDGFPIYDVTGQCVHSSGDDAVSIACLTA